jgi:predicted secreted Zn-dependent protease
MFMSFGFHRRGAVAQRVLASFGVAGLLLAGLQPLQAQPHTLTSIKYYTVSGSTAQSLDQQMISRGPWHGQGRAYANIVAKPDYSGQLVEGQTCRLEDFKVTAHFTMTLPKLANGTKLSKDLTARWNSFQNFVRRHEEGHRAIWIDTMRSAQSRIIALRAPTCSQLQAQIDTVFQEEWRAGERRQDAYDRADQQKLVRHPLIQAAASARRKVTSTYAAQPTQARAARRLVGGSNR